MKTQIRSVSEWWDRCMEGGTSGDMVFDILNDWKIHIENEQFHKDNCYVAGLEDMVNTICEGIVSMSKIHNGINKEQINLADTAREWLTYHEKKAK